MKHESIVFLGLSITSSWGNGRATTYSSLVRGLDRLGYRVSFFERDVEWYADNRDDPQPDGCTVVLYDSLAELDRCHREAVRDASAVIVGSYVPDGAEVVEWVLSVARGLRLFYDIDTPVTLRALSEGTCTYLRRADIPRLDAYLSFTGGPVLGMLEREFGARAARPLYCSAEPMPALLTTPPRIDLGYLGTYSEDRQPCLDRLLVEPARRWASGRFVVAGASYPESLVWPDNVDRHVHVPPREHPRFYAGQRFTLNVTRADMVRLGYSPSVRLFEAAACGTPVISDAWPGLEEFFVPGREILLADSPDGVLDYLRKMPEKERRALGQNASARVLGAHTGRHRASELASYLEELGGPRAPRTGPALARPLKSEHMEALLRDGRNG